MNKLHYAIVFNMIGNLGLKGQDRKKHCFLFTYINIVWHYGANNNVIEDFLIKRDLGLVRTPHPRVFSLSYKCTYNISNNFRSVETILCC